MRARGDRSAIPRIGVSSVRPESEASQRYLAAVRYGGGEPVELLAGAASWDDEISRVDGLLLTGGPDMAPCLYGEPNLGSRDIDKGRDRLELQALDHCRVRGLPVLAICRGFQLVNVAFGGSLVQDIRSGIEHHAAETVSRFHGIEIVPGTRLAEIAGGKRQIVVNSRHHQGVDAGRVAGGLRPSARSADGIVEGLEGESGPFLVAVQCHPERRQEVPELSALFAALVKQARRA